MKGTLHSGDHIGDWVIEATLGHGGMGSVYRCHSKLSSKVRAAVKVIEVLDNERDEARARFIREIEVLEGLRHTNIVRVRGGGEDPDRSLLYLAMDLIEGHDLQRACMGTAVPWREAGQLIQQIAEGLQAAHQMGVHHRDIKPANIMLQDDNTPILIDFGIAIQQGQHRLTRRNGVLGTMAYIPPELFAGQPYDPVKADIYALGLVFWELVTGKVAFPDTTHLTPAERQASLMNQKASAKPMDPGEDFPDELRILLGHCTHPQSDKRLDSAEALAVALGQLVGKHTSNHGALTRTIGPAPDTSRDTFTLDPELPTELGTRLQPQSSFPWVSFTSSVLVATLPTLLLGLGLLLYNLGITLPGLILSGLYILLSPLALPIAGLAGLMLTFMCVRQLRTRRHTHPGWYALSVLLSAIHLFQLALGAVLALTVAANAFGYLPDFNDAQRGLRDFYDSVAPEVHAVSEKPSTTIAGASTCPTRSVLEHS